MVEKIKKKFDLLDPRQLNSNKSDIFVTQGRMVKIAHFEKTKKTKSWNMDRT